MKIRMKTLSISLALVAVLAVAGLAIAQGHMGDAPGHMTDPPGHMGDAQGHAGNGPGMDAANLTPEKQAAVQKLYADFNSSTAPVRQQLYAKQAEMNALYASGTTDSKKYQSLSREIGDLNAKLYEAQANLRSQLVKQGVPASGMYMGGGHGGGHGGYMGGGHGGHMGGGGHGGYY
ncbi:MAG: periplasmic heavy metal sensor [Desulfovibrio sp.]|jgi:zinc resistance-associated protein|nr:periplasmic heavy metal sensor [Desulfovibrio sp.]